MIFLFFLGLTSFPKLCVNISAKNYMAYIKERREYKVRDIERCIGKREMYIGKEEGVLEYYKVK